MVRKIVEEWLRILLGLVVFAFGVHCTIRANIGLAPWDCFGMGISYHTPLTYGLAMTCMSVAILCIDLLLQERIGYGTVIDAICTGNFVQWYNDHSPVKDCTNVWQGILLMLGGLAIMALGQFIYMRAAQGCGPRDSLLVGLGKRLKTIPIGAVSVTIYIVVLALGWLLGGPVGIGTLIGTVGSGVMMQLVFTLLRFEPRSIRHKDVVETTRMLKLKAET